VGLCAGWAGWCGRSVWGGAGGAPLGASVGWGPGRGGDRGVARLVWSGGGEGGVRTLARGREGEGGAGGGTH